MSLRDNLTFRNKFAKFFSEQEENLLIDEQELCEFPECDYPMEGFYRTPSGWDVRLCETHLNLMKR